MTKKVVLLSVVVLLSAGSALAQQVKVGALGLGMGYGKLAEKGEMFATFSVGGGMRQNKLVGFLDLSYDMGIFGEEVENTNSRYYWDSLADRCPR